MCIFSYIRDRNVLLPVANRLCICLCPPLRVRNKGSAGPLSVVGVNSGWQLLTAADSVHQTSADRFYVLKMLSLTGPFITFCPFKTANK